MGRDIWIATMGLFLLPVRQMIPLPQIDNSVSLPAFHATNFASADITGAVNPANAVQLASSDAVSSIAVSIPWHLIWAAGMLVYFAVRAVCYLQFRRLALKGAYPCQLASEAVNRALAYTAWDGKLKILYRSGLETPLTFGLLSPVILLPDKFYSSEHLQMVLIHELLHIKTRDLLYKLVAMVVAGVHWFNPLAHCLAADMDAACELNCDYETVKILGDENRKCYCELLIETAIKPCNTLGGHLFMGLGIGKGLLKRRVYSIMGKNTQRPFINVLAATAVAAVCLLGAACAPKVTTRDTDGLLSQPPTQNDLTLDNGFSSAANSELDNISSEETSDSFSDSSQSVDASQQISSLDQDALLRLPLIAGEISNPFNGYPGHMGVDFSAEMGTEILAAASGVVVLAESPEHGYGRHIIIDHGAGVKTVYAHCDELLVQAGQKVQSGDVIAKVGDTGSVTGPLLHFELRIDDEYINPIEYMKERFE